MADDFQRLLAGDRRAHRLLDILGIAYFQSVHAFRLAFPARPIEMAVFVAPSDHPSKAVAERHKGELSRAARGVPRRAGLPAREPTSSALPSYWPPGSRSTLSLRPLSKHLHA